MQLEATISEQKLQSLERQISTLQQVLGFKLEASKGMLKFEISLPSSLNQGHTHSHSHSHGHDQERLTNQIGGTGKNPQKLTFLLHLDSDRIYRIFECPSEADLPGFEQFVVDLNQHQDIVYFVHCVRKRFITYMGSFY